MLPSAGAVKAFNIFSQVTGLIPLAGFVLFIIGAVNVRSFSQLTSQPLLNAGRILFAVTYHAVAVSTIIAWGSHRNIPRQRGTSGEGVLIAAVAIALRRW